MLNLLSVSTEDVDFKMGVNLPLTQCWAGLPGFKHVDT